MARDFQRDSIADSLWAWPNHSKDISGLGLDELKALLVQALEKVARLEKENAELREEIAQLKGLKGRPKLKPSGMEKATEGPAARSARTQRPPRRQADKARH